MAFKVWIEIEEVDDEGEPINEDHDYSFPLPFASSALCDTHQDALDVAVAMHNAVNRHPHLKADYVQLETEETI